MSIHDVFREQAKHCEALGSPFMGRLMTLFADRLAHGDPVSDIVIDWPGDPRTHADSVPLRLAGALHALRLDGLALRDVYPPHEVDDAALWAAVGAAMRDHAPRVLDWLKSAPQTNEVRRAAAILPALALLNERFGQPAALFELGCSGGLNLRADRFCLDAEGIVLGLEDSPVRLAPEWRGEPPVGSVPEVVYRAGVDLNPLDPGNPADRLRLLAYLWPDQKHRLDRTEAAIAIAAKTPAEITRGDAGVWLGEALAEPRPGLMRVVFHTVAWQYFPPDSVAAAEAALATAAETATEDAPLAHLSFEADGGVGAALTLTVWPDGEPRHIGRADFHGRWIDWRASDV